MRKRSTQQIKRYETKNIVLLKYLNRTVLKIDLFENFSYLINERIFSNSN
jgi:hypothetical protein